MNKSDYVKAAKLLYDLRINSKNIKKLPFNLEPKNINEGYNIQKELSKIYLKNNKIIGYKIGCTNKEAQKQINIEHPFYGYIFSNYSSTNKCVLDNKKFINPYFEPEFSFKFKDSLNFQKKIYKLKDLKEIIKYCLPSVEIVDPRYNNWTKVGISNLVADNAANSYWVRGKPISNIPFTDLLNQEVKVYFDNKLISIGNSKNVLKNPLNSIVWLLNNLSKNDLKKLNNLYVSTGTCTPAIKMRGYSNFKAFFGSIGSVELSFF